MSSEEEALEKQACLLELERLRGTQGVHLSKQYTIHDRLEDMQLEIKRQLLTLDEARSVELMRSALSLCAVGVEMASSKLGVLDLDGWSAEFNRDLGNQKMDHSLRLLYAKYWRRPAGSSPELDICLSVGSSIAMYQFRKKMMPAFGGLRPPPRSSFPAPSASFPPPSFPPPSRPAPPVYDDEGIPDAFMPQ